MSNPRRRLLRFPTNPPAPDPQRQHRLQQLRAKLAVERAALARWMTRLRRAFHAVEKVTARMARLERRVTQEEG